VARPAVSGLTATGNVYRLTAGGFQPGERVVVTIDTGSTVLATAQANEQGVVTLSWTMPASVTAGSHTVVVTGERSGAISQTFTITPTGSLSTTGAPVPASLIGFGLLCLLAGGVTVAVAIRRQRRRS